MLNWTAVLAGRLERKFKEVAADGCLVGHLHENLYVTVDPQRRSVTLFTGQHAVGQSLQGSGTASEGDAALTVSQAADGSVAIFLYPFKSELMHRHEKLIVWGIFKAPDDVSDRLIGKAVDDARRYWRVSSVLDGGSRADRMRVGILMRKAQLREALSKHPWTGKSLKIGTWFVGFMGFLSAVATLSGTSVPQLWDRFHPSTDSGMPIVSGWYTFCPQDATGASANLRNLLYDIRSNAGKVAFFDVQVDVDCVMDTPLNPEIAFSRKAHEGSLTYSFMPRDTTHDRVDGGRDASRPLVPENGTFVTVSDDRDGRNAFTRLNINSEGADDVLYGPYLIKAGGEDAATSFDLIAPTLDSSMQSAASIINGQRRTIHVTEASTRIAPSAIPLSKDDLRRLREYATSPAAGASGAHPPIALPPIDINALSRIPPIPTAAHSHSPGSAGSRSQ